MVISEEEDWEVVGDDIFDLVGEQDRFPSSGSENNSVAASSDSDSSNEVEAVDYDLLDVAPSSLSPSQLRCHRKNGYYARAERKPAATLEDIIREYGLCFLPATSLIRFRAVSKTWDQRITFPFLAHQQSNCFRELSGFFCQSSQNNGLSSLWTSDPFFLSLDRTAYAVPSPNLAFLPEKVRIRSSCNGLLCCQSEYGEYGNGYYICNPATTEWLKLPSPHLYHGLSNALAVLAFDPFLLNFTPVYYVICAVQMMDFPMIKFEVYSSMTGEWDVCEDVLCCEEALDLKTSPGGGFYMNGVAYWKTSSGKVLAFDIHNKDYGILPLPHEGGVLVEMRGEVCCVEAHYGVGGECVVNVYGLHDLNPRQRIPIWLGPEAAVGGVQGHCRALPSLNIDVLAVRAGRMVFCHRVKDGETLVLNSVEDDSWGDLHYWPYVNSLVQVEGR